jgi:hypothetical protein
MLRLAHLVCGPLIRRCEKSVTTRLARTFLPRQGAFSEVLPASQISKACTSLIFHTLLALGLKVGQVAAQSEFLERRRHCGLVAGWWFGLRIESAC